MKKSSTTSAASASRTRRFDDGVRAAAWFCLVVAVFLGARGYFGFVHDNILYLAQALARLEPEIYQGDIYLAWGSQDRYTVFSPVYAWLIGNYGLESANLLLVGTALSLFLGASFIFVRTWVPAGMHGYAMLFIAASNGLYGASFIFKMGEQFAIPRPFVEALVLFGAALLVSGRRTAAFALVLMGGLLHPLVALSGLIFCWLYLVVGDRRWLWMLLFGLIPLAAGIAGIAPFGQLLQRFDPQWLGALLNGNQHVFVSEWQVYDWALIAWDVSVLVMAHAMAEGGLRRVARTGLALAAVSLGVTVIGADLLRNVLITNLQIWRGMWIVHWLALAFLPWVLRGLWNAAPAGKLVAGAALFGFFLRGLYAGLFSALFSLLLFFAREKLTLDRRIANLALWVFGVGAYLHWYAISDRANARAPDVWLDPVQYFVHESASKPFVLVSIALAVVFLGLRRGRVRAAALVALALLAVAVATWDRRLPIKKYAETVSLGSHPFSRYVRRDQEIFWYEEPSAPWVLMQRRSYLSGAQAAGQMFNRGTAMQLMERREVMNALEFQEQFCQFMNKGNNRDDACVDDVQPLVDACRDGKGLDFIVLETRRGNVAVATWTPPVEYPAYRPTYYLYDCKQLAGR